MLDECLLRIPDDFDSTERLLKYGLLGTSWEIIQAIDGVENEDELKYCVPPEPESGDEKVEKKFTGTWVTFSIYLVS